MANGHSFKIGISRRKPRMVRLSSRDLALLEDLYGHRVLSRDQIIGLGYFNSVSRCNYRLRSLLDHSFVRRVCVGNGYYGQALYAIGASAIDALRNRSEIDILDLARQAKRSVAPLFLSHTLAIVDFRIQLQKSAKEKGAVVERWLPEISCRHEYSYRTSAGSPWCSQILKPDAYFRLRWQGHERCCFVEVDLGHVSSRKFAGKVESFQTYRSLNLFRETYGASDFQVLVVTTGLKRLSHLKSHAAGHPTFLFTTFDRIRAEDVFGCIWQSRSIELVDLFAGVTP